MADYYDMLGAAVSASDKEIQRAYRKMALKLHPDKHPNNPEMTKKFQLLVEAYTVLSNQKRKAEYDQTMRARHLRKKREESMSSKRRKLAEDLRMREEEALRQKDAERLAKMNLENEILKFRQELEKESAQDRKSSNLREKQLERSSTAKKRNLNAAECTLELGWDNSVYSYKEEELRAFLQPFGTIEKIIYIGEKSLALVMFESAEGANAAATVISGTSSLRLSYKGKHRGSEPLQSLHSGIVGDYEEERDDEQYQRFLEYEKATLESLEHV